MQQNTGWLLLGMMACGGADSNNPGEPGTVAGSTVTETKEDPGNDTGEEPLPTEAPTGPARRFDCSGLDPADPAPLGRLVALTFDDGPLLQTTPAILETLRAHDAPATFMVVGTQLTDPNTWSLVEEMVDDPLFDLANHSWDHPDLSSLSPDDLRFQIDETTGLMETFGVTPQFFRFPFGAANCDAVDLVRSRGMHVVGWHIDTADWCYAALGESGVCERDDYFRVPEEYADDMIGFTLEQLERFEGGVVLLHDIHQFTVDNLDALLTAIEEAGFVYTTLDDLVAFPRLNTDAPADLPYLGEACDPMNDACWQVEYQSWCEPTDASNTTGFCTLPCEGFCLDRPGAATTFCATVDPGAGQCVGRFDSENEGCDLVSGTEVAWSNRWLGSSGAPPAREAVCVPPGW